MSSSSSSPPAPPEIARLFWGEKVTYEVLRQELDRAGVVVIKGVLLPMQVAVARKLLWDWLEKLAPGVERDSPSKWVEGTRPPHQGGLIQHFGVGWNGASVYVRECVKPVFDRVWGTDGLWCSFDGISVTFNNGSGRKRKLDDDKWNVHVDQTSQGFKSVQGGVALTRQARDSHCFACVPGSHKIHEKLMGLHRGILPAHWCKADIVMVQSMKNHGLQLEVVDLEEGDLVLWRSDLMHFSVPYAKEAPASARREQIFVSMGPPPAVAKTRAAEVAKRRKYYEENRTSMHSTDRVRVFGKEPRTFGEEEGKKRAKMQVQPPAELTESQKKMHGLN